MKTKSTDLRETHWNKALNTSRHGWVDSMLACLVGGLRSLVQISLLPKLAIHHCLPSTACMRDVQKWVYCTHSYTVYTLLVEKADVAPNMTLMFTVYKQVWVLAREPPSWGGSHKVQNRGNQWPHKMDLGPAKENIKKALNSERHSIFQASVPFFYPCFFQPLVSTNLQTKIHLKTT